MRHFDVRKQLNGESLAVFEQGLRTLHGEAWPGVDLKSPDADSRLRRKFVDGLMDGQIQTYLRLHATSDDFPTTVAKARQYEDADKLYRTAKKPPFVRHPSPIICWTRQPMPSWTGLRHIYWETEAARRRSIPPRCPTSTPTQDPRARGLLSARDRRRLVMYLQEALPVVSHLMAAPSGSKTR